MSCDIDVSVVELSDVGERVSGGTRVVVVTHGVGGPVSLGGGGAVVFG
jgi:hypothetical protein